MANQNLTIDLNKGTATVRGKFDTASDFLNLFEKRLKEYIKPEGGGESRFAQGRDNLRKSQEATKGVFVRGNNKIKSLAQASEGTLLGTFNFSELPTSEDEEAAFLLAVLDSSFFVLSDQGQDGVGPLQRKVLDTLARIGSLRGTAGEEDILASKEANKARESYTKSTTKLPITNLKGYSKEQLGREVALYITREAAKWTVGQDFLGIPAKTFLVDPNISNLSVKRKIIIAAEDTSSPTKFIVEQVVNIVVKRGEDPTTLDPRFQSRSKEAFSGEYETQVIELKETDITPVNSTAIQNAKKLIKELRETTKAGSRLVQFGHITSISTESLVALRSAIENALSTGTGLFGSGFSQNEVYIRIKNVSTTIQAFINILQKIDNLIFNLGASTSLPNYNDLKTFVSQGGLSGVDISDLTLFAKVGQTLVKTGEIAKDLQLDATLNVDILAMPELQHINEKVKAKAQTALNNLFLGYIGKDFGKILTEEDILRAWTQTSSSDSIITGLIKRAFGIPIKKGKKTSKKKKSKIAASARKIRNDQKTVRVPKSPSTKQDKQSVIIGGKINLAGKTEGTFEEPESLLVRLNNIITKEVINQMNSSTLQNRTGRFANSVEILAITGNSIVFDYMRRPYDVFSRDNGRAPWNSRQQRDPSHIINRAILSGIQNLGEIPNFKTGKQ
jgi:hypothetical protein